MKTTQSARLELRLPMQKKIYFEEVAALGGFKSLSDFILDSANQLANKITEEHNKILATQKDKKIFFDALMNPPKPNQALKKAFKKYNESVKLK
ncbi:DUF1778 domain-containing protein [Chitinophagaceae bacterium 26-R-25]|nr:DUF1778 domain-containing protein [Chitinophagaceae bacterium 26-R-25]